MFPTLKNVSRSLVKNILIHLTSSSEAYREVFFRFSSQKILEVMFLNILTQRVIYFFLVQKIIKKIFVYIYALKNKNEQAEN